jgi:uncharacterized protein YbaR (Trm112 family)
MTDFKRLEDILQCPITNEKLDFCESPKYFGPLKDIATKFNALKGFINKSKTVLYPIKNDIIIMLPEYAITSLEYHTDDNILSVKSFYDRFGWKKTEDGKYNDNKLFVNQEKAAGKYLLMTTKRVNHFLKENGTYLLDIASGPVYQTEYIRFSKNFKYRICIDISLTALEEAKKNLNGQNGFFILGDITNIPLRNESCDNVISMHTLYHVPKQKQILGINELVRVSKTNANIVIAYNWGWHSMLMNFALFPTRLGRLFGRANKLLFKKSINTANDSESGLYFYSHSKNYFVKHKPENTKIRFSVLRSLHHNFIRLYLSNNDRSKLFLDRIYELEDKYPTFFGKHGAFPLIIIEKLSLTNN